MPIGVLFLLGLPLHKNAWSQGSTVHNIAIYSSINGLYSNYSLLADVPKLISRRYDSLGLYSRDVNVLAWHIMLVEMSRGHTEEIIHALFQPHMTHTDVQVYVQQLVVCHLAKWSV